jgi:Domain of unknown function (DUF4382)
MKRIRRTAGLISLMAAVALGALTGCSGVGSGSGPGPGNQNASLVVTMTSKPSISLANISVLSAAVGITGIALNPSTGTAVSLTLSPTVYPVDLARLQSDTALLGSLSLPAATYTSATLTFSAPVLTILNQTGGTLNGTCLSGTICHIVLTAGSAQVTTTPFPLTLTSGQATGVSINLDLNTALTVTSGTLALNFSTANVATAATLPRTGAPTGSLDLVEDFVGKITAKTSSSITVVGANGVTLQLKLPTSPIIEDPQGLCGAVDATCLVANQTVVSVDAIVNTDGTLTLDSADLLDATPQDEVEGTLLANGVAGQFFLVVSNKVVATGNNTLASANVGDTFLVTLNNPLFIVDTDEFFNNASLPPSNVTTLFSSEADLVDGQDVMVHVTAATGTAAGADQAITTDRVRLRFTRTTGSVQSVSGQSFTLANVPPFIPFITNPLVDTIPNATNFDGVTDVNSITAAQNVSIRALLLNNSVFSFYAAKVRVQP